MFVPTAGDDASALPETRIIVGRAAIVKRGLVLAALAPPHARGRGHGMRNAKYPARLD